MTKKAELNNENGDKVNLEETSNVNTPIKQEQEEVATAPIQEQNVISARIVNVSGMKYYTDIVKNANLDVTFKNLKEITGELSEEFFFEYFCDGLAGKLKEIQIVGDQPYSVEVATEVEELALRIAVLRFNHARTNMDKALQANYIRNNG